MSDNCEVLKYWAIKDGFCSISQKVYMTAILRWVDQKTSKLLAEISFDNSLQDTVLANLLLLLCAYY